MFPIQKETFEIIASGKDILASDRTGSGKTLAYVLPILERLESEGASIQKSTKAQFLILCPTRELTNQVASEVKKFLGNRQVLSVYGGTSIQEQINHHNSGVGVLVATPGRLIDLLERKAIDLSQLKVVCLDEADTMLEKGFKDDV